VKLVDTSAWIEQLRRNGDAAVRRRVEGLLVTGEAAWCPVVRLELWTGAGGRREQRVLRDMERELQTLEVTPTVWDLACRLAANARAQGITVPASDLLVAACARHHEVELEHADSHFEMIARL
jgi:predicted nucleic acid-binding protein